MSNMRKAYVTILLFSILTAALLQIRPLTFGNPSAVTVAQANDSCALPSRNIVQAQGYYYVFYVSPTTSYLVYKSSHDGVTFSSEYNASDAALNPANCYFTVLADGSTVHIAYPKAQQYAMTRVGVAAGGQITWNNSVQVWADSVTSGIWSFSLVKTANRLYLSVMAWWHPTYGFGVFVFQSADNGATWTQILSKTGGNQTPWVNPIGAVLVRAGNNEQVMLIRSHYTWSYFTYNFYDGSSWTSDATFGSIYGVYCYVDSMSAVWANGEVHLGFIDGLTGPGPSPGPLKAYYYDGSWHGGTVDSSSYWAPALVAYSTQLYLFHWSGNAIYYRTMNYSTHTWSSRMTWLSGESLARLNAEQYPPESRFGIIWKNGTNIRFDQMSFITNAAPTIGNFEAPAIVYANKYFLFNATVDDADGVSDLKNATVQLSNSVVLSWIRLTHTFGINYDPNGYCTLDSSGSFETALNDTALKLTWKIELGWSYPEGYVSVIGTDTKVFDDSEASGGGSYANLFTFEDDLILYSASCSEADNRTGCGQLITFNGTLYYEGTETPPEDVSGITVKVDANGVLRGSTTAIASDGAFSLTIQAESTVNFYIYTVYAITDQPTVENQTFGIIVDKLSITIIPSKLKANLNEQVTISWTIKRAYDDSVCSDFFINITRDGQLWSENLINSTITDVSSLSIQHVYGVSGVVDDIYGLTSYDALSATVTWGSLIPSSPPTIHITIEPINLGEVQATSTVNFTITATFDTPRITITKIEFQAQSSWFKVLTTLPKTYEKGLNALGTATIECQLTLPATATDSYTIPFIIHVTLPDGTTTQTNSYITLTTKTSTINFTTEAFIETVKRLLGNPIILALLIALIIWLSTYSLKKH